MNVTGRATLFSNQIKLEKDTFNVFSVSITNKTKDGEYVNASIPVILSKEARASLSVIKHREIKSKHPTRMYMIEIEDSWFNVKVKEPYNEPVMFINKLVSQKGGKSIDMDEAPW